MNQQRVLLYGLSGSGKSTAARILEDIGFRVLRNLPSDLLVETLGRSDPLARVAVLPEVSSSGLISALPSQDEPLVIFLEASDETLLARYKESRRPHPFDRGAGLIDAIRHERDLLGVLRKQAHHVIATDSLTPSQLNTLIIEKIGASDTRKLVVTFLSFGFKYGVPPEIDLCFDVRFLHNPFFDQKLRDLNGLDEPVEQFVLSQDDTKTFLAKFEDLFAFLLPCYVREGKKYLTVGIGCTGGQHRSVAIANALAKRPESENVRVLCSHRDVARASRANGQLP